MSSELDPETAEVLARLDVAVSEFEAAVAGFARTETRAARRRAMWLADRLRDPTAPESIEDRDAMLERLLDVRLANARHRAAVAALNAAGGTAEERLLTLSAEARAKEGGVR